MSTPKYYQGNKSNEQMLRALLDNLDSMEAAILRERITVIMDATVQSINDEPDQWKNPIIHPQTYLNLFEKAKVFIGFDNDETPDLYKVTYKGTEYTQDQIEAMRDWIQNTTLGPMYYQVHYMPEMEILYHVKDNYPEGVSGFFKDWQNGAGELRYDSDEDDLDQMLPSDEGDEDEDGGELTVIEA